MTALLPWLAAGVALGLVYLHLLGRSVAALTGNVGWRAAALPLALRAALAVAILTFAAQHGALPLLATLAGFLAARTFTLRREA